MWKAVINYEGVYEVSTDGFIRSLNYKKTKTIRNLLPSQDGKGYLRTALMKGGKLSTIKLHREVAKAFIPNPENKPQVNHINGIKTDNCVENLEWCNNSENITHAYKIGLAKSKNGDGFHRTKYSDEFVLKLHKELLSGTPKRELSRKYNIPRSVFKRKILNG